MPPTSAYGSSASNLPQRISCFSDLAAPNGGGIDMTADP